MTCPHCRPGLAPTVARRGWNQSDRIAGNPVLALMRIRGLSAVQFAANEMRGGWIAHTYRLRLPSGHVSVAEPYGLTDEGETRAELDQLAQFGYSYVIAADQAMHAPGETISVQLYPAGVRPVNLREFWAKSIRAGVR